MKWVERHMDVTISIIHVEPIPASVDALLSIEPTRFVLKDVGKEENYCC